MIINKYPNHPNIDQIQPSKHQQFLPSFSLYLNITLLQYLKWIYFKLRYLSTNDKLQTFITPKFHQYTMTHLLPSSTKRYLLLTVVLLEILHNACPQKISDDIDQPRYNQNKVVINQYITQSNKLISISFPQINYQISSQMFMTTNSIVIPNKIFYDEDVSNYCQMYPTNIQTYFRATLKLSENITILKYAMNYNIQNRTFYLLSSDTTLYKYIFDQTVIKTDQRTKVQSLSSYIQDGQLTTNIQMLVIGANVLFITNESIILFNSKDLVTPSKVLTGFRKIDRLLQVGVTQQGTNINEIKGYQIWVCGGKDITLYEILNVNSQYELKYQRTIQNFTNDTISAVHYCVSTQTFYVTAANALYILPTVGANKKYDLDGKCTAINKIKQVLYLTCQYERISYMMEIRADKNDQLKLNRYYDDAFLEGIRSVQSLGYDKIVLMGEQEGIVIGQAINRIPLLQLAKHNITQTKYFIYSFGLLDFYYLPQFSTYSLSVIFIITETSLTIMTIQYVPPQIQCRFSISDLGSTINMLFVFNVSHCPYSINDTNTLGGNMLQCQIYYPYKFILGEQQYEEKTARFAFFIIMLIFIVLILLCAGWGVQIRKRANALIGLIKTKIEKYKGEKSQQMKKI